ncbi:hypothetical protein T08_11277 [Trichinella sp. T8]|nr:hypothetical protein T08_11277 [Trichinella sp. T8]
MLNLLEAFCQISNSLGKKQLAVGSAWQIFLNDLISYIKNGMQSCFFNCIESPLNYVLSSVMFISLINK